MNTDLTAQRALDCLAKAGFENLSEMEKTVAAAWMFEAGVGNNGFARYYASRRADLAFYAPTALRAIGAKELAAIAEEANAVFGPEAPPRGVRERRAVLKALPESARKAFDALEQRCYASGEDVDELLERFLSGRKKRP